MPEHVRDWVADELGSPVVEADDQVGGMSPGCATRLVGEDGTRAFVKAVGTELNPKTPELFRREVTALTLIGSHELWADLRASYDDGDWVAILLEDVEGTHPDLDDDATMDTLLRETERLGPGAGRAGPRPAGTRRRQRRAGRPAGTASTCGPTRSPAPARSRRSCCRTGSATTPRPGSPWSARLADHERPARALGHPQRQPPRATHRRPGLPRLGRAVDRGRRGWTRCSPGWSGWSRRGSTPSLATSPALVAAGDIAVDAWLVGFATFLAWRAPHGRRRQPADPQRFPDQRVAAHAGRSRTATGHALA